MSEPKKITVQQAKAIKRDLDQIHKDVITNFTYMRDPAQFGVPEMWVFPNEFYHSKSKVIDDCDGFATHCRALIRRKGHPSRLVFCQCETGEYHLVVECHGWVLDNRARKVYTQKDPFCAGYRWLRISGYEPGDPWREIVG